MNKNVAAKCFCPFLSRRRRWQQERRMAGINIPGSGKRTPLRFLGPYGRLGKEFVVISIQNCKGG